MELERAIFQAKSLEELLPIVQKADAKMSFWGWRHVSVDGYEGSVSRYALSIRVNEIVEKDPEFDDHERSFGKMVVSHITRLYDAGTQMLDKSCFLTSFFCLIREIWMNVFSYKCEDPYERWITYHQNQFYECYTRNQYQEVFGREPPNASSDIAPSRWGISEANRQKLLRV